jgi:dienelactone hydrolase
MPYAEANSDHAPSSDIMSNGTEQTSDPEVNLSDPKHGRLRLPPAAWNGAAIGVVIAALIVSTTAGASFHSGLGVVIDATLGVLVGIVGVVLFAALTRGLAAIFGKLSRRFLFAVGGAAGTVIALQMLGFRWPEEVYYRSLFTFLFLNAALAGAIWLVATGHAKQLPGKGRAALLSILPIVVGLDIAGVVWLADAGVAVRRHVTSMSPAGATVSALEAPNPAEHGAYDVRTVFYGSGTDKRRPEFGEGVDIVADPVDASALLPEWKGFRARMRKWYWGFGIDEYPLNGRVWLPEGEGPFPLVLVVHGNHSMEEHSDPGYAYLGELLASRGFITVSVDENLTNATWSGDFGGDEQQVRAWILLQHLRVWHEWNAIPEHTFYRKVDVANIGLIGHSRGGEAVAMAAVFNRLPYYPDDASVAFGYDFSIKSVIAIAPTDYRYHRRLTMENVNYLTLHGSYDTDVPSFYGMRQYQRVRFTDDRYWFKAALYIHYANHGQFNTVWGREEASAPRSWFLSLEPLVAGDEQRQIGKVYMAAFLEATLRGKREYIPMFHDPRRIAHWLPETRYRLRFEDSSFRRVADYEEDIDVTTASVPGSVVQADHLDVWREVPLPFRRADNQLNNAVYLGWRASDAGAADSAASYTVVLPENQDGILPSNPLLVFALSATPEVVASVDGEDDTDDTAEPEGPPDLTIELADAFGATASIPLSEFATIQEPFETPLLMKTDGLSRSDYGDIWEPILETYELSVGAFVAVNPRFDPRALRMIRFRLDARSGGVIVLDDVGFRQGP